MRHAPLPDRVAWSDQRLPAVGMLVAISGSAAVWAAIYAASIARF